jgi:hypothetical protein
MNVWQHGETIEDSYGTNILKGKILLHCELLLLLRQDISFKGKTLKGIHMY